MRATMRIETAFLSELDSEEIFRCLKAKVEQNRPLSDEELMQFIILPLSYRKKEEKQQKLHDAVALAAAIQDRKQQIFALTGILVFTDKIIDKETADRIRRTIEMTQVAQIFEEEKRLAVAQVEKKLQQAKKEKRLAEEKNRQIVINMIKKNYPTQEIISLVSDYSPDDIERLRKECL